MQSFKELPLNPLDQIMVANQEWPAFLAEYPDAINTTVGTLTDPNAARAWQPETVQYAREWALRDAIGGGSFGYQTQAGYAAFNAAVSEHILGDEFYTKKREDSLFCFQTLGGTGALSLAKDSLRHFLATDDVAQPVLVFDSGWPNYQAIFGEDFELATYQHMNDMGGYNHRAAVEAFEGAPEHAVFLVQTAGYNDDGLDRTKEEWDEILNIASRKDAIMVLDSAYLGLSDGLEKDRYPLEKAARVGLLTLVCFSASKNMGLYNERVGALMIINAPEVLGEEQATRFKQLIAREVRKTVSNPPLVAAKAAAVALGQGKFYDELEDMRRQLVQNRNEFATFIPGAASGKGLFTKILPDGFTEAQQMFLKNQHIHVLPNSRINLGGVHKDQIERVGEAILGALQLVS